MMENKLKYSSPAGAFEESLILGSGSLGAAVYGNPSNDRISLNSDTFWSGLPGDDISDRREAVSELQRLVLDGKIAEAEELTVKEILHDNGAKYLPVGSVYIKSEGEFSDYKRTLDLEKAVAEVTYTSGGVNFKREYFASFPDSCIAIRITADKPKSVSFTLSAETPFKSTFKESGGMLIMQGESPYKFHMDENRKITLTYSDEPSERCTGFTTAVKVIADNQKFVYGDIAVENSDEAVIFICIETGYSGFDRHPFTSGRPHEKLCVEHISKLSDFESVKLSHIKDFSELYSRAAIDLCSPENSEDTDVRLKNADTGDIGLYELIFNFGRYLMISSSRQGTLATNLQGIWNEHTIPPWASAYTVNINTEMNYWPAFSTNLAECFEPFVDLLEKMRINGRITAKQLYGANGFVAFHNSDIWGKASPVGKEPGRPACRWGYWNMASGWMSVQLYDLYEYTLDKDLLKNRIYPIMKEAAEFYMDTMIEDSDGSYILSPSTSPENQYVLNGENCAIAKYTTMTTSIIKELFDRLKSAADILGEDDEFIMKLRKIKLPELKADSEGRLLEWDREYPEQDRHHRHVSHLFSLFPGELINPETTPELAEMCKKSLEARGDGGTGWSLAWKVNLYAMLRLGDRALDILKNQLNLVRRNDMDYGIAGGTYPNMLCAHPPFQIDGNFGVAAGIANMLLQSKPGKITVLPALPKTWKNGSFKGLVAKGNVSVSAAWKDGRIAYLSVVSPVSQHITITAGEKLFEADIESGKEIRIL